MKTIINLLLGVAILGTLCTACRRDGDAHEWTGRVLEFGSDKPIAGATVYLLEVSGEILGPGGSRVVDSLVSDGAGRFTFRYADNPKASHRIRARADQYYEQEVSAGSNRSKITKDITLDPYAWAKILLHADRGKIYSVRVENDYCRHSFFGDLLEDVNEVICPKGGNRESPIKVIYNPQSGLGLEQKIISQKVYFPAHDTTLVEVRYED